MTKIKIEKLKTIGNKIYHAVGCFFCPPQCAVCGEIGIEGLCEKCRVELEEAFLPQKFLCRGGNGYVDQMFSLFPYRNEAVRAPLLSMKRAVYDDQFNLFLSYLNRAKKRFPALGECDFVSFCPRSSHKKFKIGFDQSEELAKRIAKCLNLPENRTLFRRGISLSQHSLKKADSRRKNIRGKFYCKKKFYGANILLIDDIVTSGATADEAARTLKENGAMKVYVLCLAH